MTQKASKAPAHRQERFRVRDDGSGEYEVRLYELGGGWKLYCVSHSLPLAEHIARALNDYGIRNRA